MYLKTRLTVAVASMALSVESSTLELHDSSTFNDLSCETNFTDEPNSTKMDEVDYESLPTDRLSVHLVAGGAAGVMEHCVMYPVDCVKVSVSVQTGGSCWPEGYVPACHWWGHVYLACLEDAQQRLGLWRLENMAK